LQVLEAPNVFFPPENISLGGPILVYCTT